MPGDSNNHNNMHAIVHQTYGSINALQLEEMPVPTPEPDEVLVRIHAAAVNDWELGIIYGKPLFMRLFLGLFRPNKTRILGCDVAGTVEEVGSASSRFSIGDQVYGDLSGCGFGAFAEYVCAPETALELKPSTLSFQQSAAIPHAAMLALQALRDYGNIKEGMQILINGAGGGVGVLALQYARLFDCQVDGVDNGRKQTYLQSLGFDHCINYEEVDFTRTGKQYDLILDVKTTHFPRNYIRALKPGGRYITVGGHVTLVLLCNVVNKWFNWRYRKQTRALPLKPNKGLKEFTALIETHNITPTIDSYYALKDTPDAIQRFADAQQQGKIIITLSDSLEEQ